MSDKSGTNKSTVGISSSKNTSVSNSSVSNGNSRGLSIGYSMLLSIGYSMLYVSGLNLDGDIDGGVDGSGVSGDDGLGRVGVVCGVVDVGGLNDLLDGVDLVRGWDRDSSGDSDLIGGWDMLVNNDGPLNWDRDMDGDINIVVLDIDLGDDVGLLGSDPGVSPHRGLDHLLGDSISRSRAIRDRCWGDSSNIGSSVRDDGSGKRDGLSEGLGSSSNIAVSRLGDVLNSCNGVLMSTNDRNFSGLYNLVSNNSVFNTFLNLWGSSGICLVCLSYNNGGRGNRSTMGNSWAGSISTTNGTSMACNSMACNSMATQSSTMVDGWSTIGASHKSKSNL